MSKGKNSLDRVPYPPELYPSPTPRQFFSETLAAQQEDQQQQAAQLLQQALADYGQAITLDLTNAELYIARGDTRLTAGNAQLALADYARAIQFDDANSEVYFRRGQLYQVMSQQRAQESNLGRAAEDYTIAIVNDPLNVGYYTARATVYTALGQYVDAVADYTSAIELDPDISALLRARGQVHHANGKYQAAIVDFTHGIKLDPGNGGMYNLRAESHHASDAFKLAEDDFARAIELEPNSFQHFLGRANLRIAQDNLQDAVADLSSAILVFYCVTGGIIASVYTDLVQGAIMVVAAVLVFVTVLGTFDGGMAEMSQVIAADDREAMGPWGTLGMFGGLSWMLVFALGTAGQPHVITKYMMLKNVKDIKRVVPLGAFAYGVAALLWIGLGISMRALVLSGGHDPLMTPDAAASAFLQSFAHPLLAGVVFAALLAAIMSTADGFLNIGTAAVIHDFPVAFGGRPVQNELLWARVTTVGIAIVAALFALYSGDLVALLGAFGWGTFAAAIVPVIAIGLNWKGATATAATYAIASSLVVNFGVRITGVSMPYGVDVGAASLVVSLTLFLGISLLSTPDELDADVEAAGRARAASWCLHHRGRAHAGWRLVLHPADRPQAHGRPLRSAGRPRARGPLAEGSHCHDMPQHLLLRIRAGAGGRSGRTRPPGR